MALPRNWQAAVLRGIGAPVTAQNLRFLNEWHLREGGGDKNSANFNPLNTTQGAPGATSMNSVGVKAYRSPNQGIRATVETLLNGHYNDIVGGLRQNVGAARLASSKSLSVWGTGRWASQTPPKSASGVRSLLPRSGGSTQQAGAQSLQDTFREQAVNLLLQQSTALAQGEKPGSSDMLGQLAALKSSLPDTTAQDAVGTASTRSPKTAIVAGSKGGRGIQELFYDPEGGIKFGKQIGAIGGHTDHVHVSLAQEAAQKNALAQARRMGLRVGQESDADVTRVHVPTSFHYKHYRKGDPLREAADISGSAKQMDAFYRWVKRTYG